MYKLEDRILFDAAAVADVADAQQEADAQAEAAAQAAEEAAAQEAAESADDGDFDNTEADDPGSLEAVLAAVEAGNLGSDGQRVDVLLVSNSLENAEDIINATSSDTIVVRYDARTTSAADLLQQITDALDGNLADSIGFATESGENAEVQLFADTDTSLDTVNDATHQDFFNGLNTLLDEGAKVNLFASNLASTTEGTALVDAIGDSIGHDVAASSDETGAESAGGDWNLEYSTSGVEVDIAETYLDENLIDNFDSLLEDHTNHEVVFINSSVMNVEEILAQLDPDIEIVMIEAGGDGLEQITNYLNEHSDTKYDAVHIITHGNEGYFNLSNSHVDSDYAQANSAELVQWRNALSDDADIMIYGCNLAESAAGRDLISLFASATGADIAASTDMVRNNDWSLEYNIGDINYGSLDILNYNHNLVDYTVTTIEDVDFSSKVTLREAIELINAEGDSGGGTISFTSLDKLGGLTIRLSSDAGYRDLTVTGNVTINGQISIGDGQYKYVNITRAAASANTGDLEVDRAYLESYTNSLDTNIDAIQAAIDAVVDPAHPTTAEINAMRSAISTTMGKNGPSSYTGSAYQTSYYSSLVNTDGDNVVDIAEADAAAIIDPAQRALAEADAQDARDAQDLIDDPGTGFDTLIASNWTSAKSAFGPTGASIQSVAAAEAFVSWFTNMSTNSTEIYSPTAADPTDTIISEANNVAARSDTNPDDHYRLMTITSGGDLTLINANLFSGYSDVAISGGIAAGRGGAIYISEGSSATLINVNVTRNSEVDAGIFTGNQSTHEGGAIYNAGSLTVYKDASLWADPDSPSHSISNNKAGTSGGAIYSTGTLSLKGSGVNSRLPISNNTASDGSGGGIYSEGAITLMENVSLSSNTASEHGGGAYITSINDALEFKTIMFSSNTATNGSGGGLAYVDSPGALTIIQSDFRSNNAKVNGGAIYMENTGDFTYLGTRYVSDEYQFCYENMVISSNSVSDGEGGGLYLSRVGNVILNSLDFNYNSGDNDNGNATLGGGAIKMADSGNLSIIDSNFIGNNFGDNVNGNGGAIDYDGGTSGDKTLSIATSYFQRNGFSSFNGGAIYQTAGNLNIVNSTFDFNWPWGNGGAIWIDSSVVFNANFVTFSNNDADVSGSSIFVNTGADLAGSITLTNTIINNASTPLSPQIVLPTNFTISNSSYNIFSHYSGYGTSAQRLADGNVTVATNYLDASQNYVGTATGGSAYILSNLYLSSTAVFTANYKSYTLALTNENSIAYRSGTNNGVTYDQRGNTRTVDPYGVGINASRGAFEPIFNLVVNSTADDTTMLRSDSAGYYANMAWANGITLREAIYWIDSGNGLDYGVISFNGAPGTIAKAGHNFYATDADNTITLNGNQIVWGQFRRSYSSDKTITINGVAASQDSSMRVIVDANNASRVFCIMDGTTKINHLTLQNGNAPGPGSGVEVLGTDTYGGAIYNNSGSTVTLNNVVVSNSTATAVDYRGEGYGGGIFNRGTMYLYDTTVAGNQAIAVADSNHTKMDGGHGGGIYNNGYMGIYRSTINNNTTVGNQYVRDSAQGAGIYSDKFVGDSNLTLYIENSTIAYNNNIASSAIVTGGEGSGLYSCCTNLSIINSTIASNYTSSIKSDADWTTKSGVFFYNWDSSGLSLNITNSIIADNYSVQLGTPVISHWNDFYITSTTNFTVSTTYNVVGFFNYGVYDFRNYTGNHVGAYLTDVGNPERGHVQDLYLNPTLDYRGGRTKVLSLLESSLLLDLATNPGTNISLSPIVNYMTGATVIANPDQRGNTRVNGSYSIGSYQPLFAVTVDISTDKVGTNHGWNWGGYTTVDPPANTPGWTSANTVRDALYWIDPTGTITFGAAVVGTTITLNSDLGQLVIDKSMTIVGGGATIQAATSAGVATNRVMYLTNPSHLSATITVKLQNMTIQNGVDSYGGGIYNTSNLTLEGVTVQNNKASSGYGGGIYSLGGSLSIGTYAGATYSNIIGNIAKSRGGGIYYEGQSTLTISQTDVLNNKAEEGSGGGVYVTGANFTLTQSTIGNNTAKVNGGGINSMSTDITILNSTIANNTTGELGGGLAYFISGTLNMNFVTIANNISGTIATTLPATTSLFGGGVYMSAGTFNMTNSVIAQNYRTSISASNRDDFYIGATITTGAVSYNVFGKTENFTIPVSNNIELGTVVNPWTDLSLDTELTNNGGPTLTLYVFNTDSVLQNGATPGSGATITTDQRGIARPATGQPTIGAYQKSITSWVYVGNATATAAELDLITNWRDATTGLTVTGPIITPDRTLYFDPTRAGGIGRDNVTITETWDVNYKTSVVLDGVAHVTVAVASPSPVIIMTAGLSVMGGSIFTVGTNASFVAATNTRVVISGSGSTINVNNTFSGTVDVSAGTLKLNATDGKFVNLTLGSLNTTSTVEYAYTGAQIIRTATYGNLTISGGSIKTSNGLVTATGTVTVSSSTFTLGGALSTANIDLIDGIITGGTHAITSTGDTTASGTSSITGGTVILNTLSAYTGDISGSTISIGGAANITGNVTATGTLTVSGALTLDNANLTAGTGIVLTNTVSTTAGTTLVPKTNTIRSSSITMDFAGSSAITVNDYSTLTFNSNAALITINTNAGNTANTFNANAMTVDSNGSLEFLTTANVVLSNINGANGIAGNLILRGYDITLNTATFNNATLTLGNSHNLNIDSGGFTVVNSIIFDGVINITGTGATISSTNGSLTFNKNIIANGYDLNLVGSTNVTVSSVTGAGDLTINAGTTVTLGNISGTRVIPNTSDLIVNSSNGIALDGTINMTGAVVLNDDVSVDGTSSITADGITFGGINPINGAGNLTLANTGTTSTTFTNGVNMTGNLSLTDGTFTTNSTVAVADLNISSLAELAMGTNILTASGSLTNAGTLTTSSTTTAAGTNITNSGTITSTKDITAGTNITNTGTMSADTITATSGYIDNSGTLTAVDPISSLATVTAGSYINNSGTFTADILYAGSDITNTTAGTMTVENLVLNGTTSNLSMGGTVNPFTTIQLSSGTNANLTSGNIATGIFTFAGSDSTSIFTLTSGTTLDVTGIITYNASSTYYDGAYFDTSGGGQLVRTMQYSTSSGYDVIYRVGNSTSAPNTSATVVTLNTGATGVGEKIAVGVTDTVKYNGGIVTGIEDTAGFTTVLERDWGGTSGSNDIVVTENWSTALEGDNFDPADSTKLFVLNGAWSDEENIIVTYTPPTINPSPARRAASYTLPHNGTYAFANAGANMTIPITNLNGNIALWEMSNPNYSSILGDVDNLTNFPIGQYPYFSTRGIFGDPASVGRSVYRHMEYRMAMNPLSNPLTGQVPAPGTLLGQAITEGADLNLTSDASVYLEVNGEYSVGRGWLPVGEPVSAANVEQYQAPITEGQLDEFYLEFGGRENIFDKPTSFRSDLDEILDDLLAG